MKTLCWLLFSVSCFGQISSVVYDSESHRGIAYASIWLQNKNTGTVADSLGRFRVDGLALKDSLNISALGYRNKSVALSHANDTIFLEPSMFVLEEIVIDKSISRKYKVGAINAPVSLIADFSEADNYENRLIIARSFNGNEIADGYFGKIRIKAYARYKRQQFAISLREIGDDGFPGKFLNAAPFIGAVKRGKNSLLKLDLSEYRIKVPQKGFFVTFEKYDAGINRFGPFIAMAQNSSIRGTLKWGMKDGRWQWYYFDKHEIIMEVEFTE